MSNEVIDDMTAIIASLTARVDELETQLKDCKNCKKVEAKIMSDDKMYGGVITTLQSAIEALGNHNMQLSAENNALSRKVSSLTEEYQIATLTKYCGECGENTHHENDWCIQCLIREKGPQSETINDPTADAKYDVAVALERELGADVSASPNNTNVDLGNIHAVESDTTDGESMIPRDNIIAGYQKVILALTHKLAEAYGMDK
jgi:cell division protein FtsB